MSKTLLKSCVKKYLDFVSFKTDRKLLIIESDDWGSIRTKDKLQLNKLNLINENVKNDRFTQLDSIASSNDLFALFDVLNSVSDLNGNPACLTANVCTANPNFSAIKKSNFQNFYYEPFNKTLENYSKEENLFSLWNEGINNKVFFPQLHGREHVNASAWLSELRDGNKDLLKAFEVNAFGIPYNSQKFNRRKNLQAALDRYEILDEHKFQENWIRESAEIFQENFGYYSNTFIAPAYIWNNDICQQLIKSHINTVQGISIQYSPFNKLNFKYIPHLRYTGQKKLNLKYLVRNIFFEPASDMNKNWENTVINAVENSFKYKRPAIISSHRINFIGTLNEKNRTKNLIMLKNILSILLKKYPQIEFINSSELSEIII